TFYRNGLKVPSTAQNTNSPGVIDSNANVTKSIGYNGPNYNGGYLKSSLDEYRLYAGMGTVGDVATLFEAGGGIIDRAARAQQDADGISIPEIATLALALRGVGSYGWDITWTAANPDIIDVDGTVTPPTDGDDVTVTLTARV